MDPTRAAIAVVIPCYRVRRQILQVLGDIGDEVGAIYVVDDACPEETGRWVEQECRDARVRVLRHDRNLGVGGAVISGYRQAIADGAAVIVKVDGDGQMDPRLIPRFVRPILAGEADYTKGNRFFDLEGLRQMPWIRLQGNAALSFITKIATGYWEVFDPTNGYTAIHARVAALLPFDRISRGFYFESEMLFRLNTLRAVVLEIPMAARYGDEVSNLKVGRAVGEFALGSLGSFVKRIFYNYYLRSFSIASVNLFLGVVLLAFGVTFGLHQWRLSSQTGVVASSGSVMLASLPIIVGVQLLLAFLGFDMQSVPRVVLHKRL
jgi:glycosyltransferase involved in cell wall biosynthesis